MQYVTDPEVWAREKLGVELHEAQKKILKDTGQRKLVHAGRKFGKTFMAAEAITQFAVEFPKSRILVIAYSFDALTTLRMQTEQFLRKSGTPLVVNNTMTKQLSNGAWIYFRSGNKVSKGLRDKSIDFLVVEEAPLMDDETLSDFRPCLACGLGAEMMIGIRDSRHGGNFFMRAIQSEAYHVFEGDTTDNPHVNKDALELDKILLPEEDWNREYFGKMNADAGSLFPEELLGKMFVEPSKAEAKPSREHVYVAGLDYGKLVTPSVLCILRKEQKKYFVESIRKFRLGTSYSDVNANVAEVMKLWSIRRICVDRTGVGEMPFEELEKTGLPVVGVRFSAFGASGAWMHFLKMIQSRAQEGNLIIPTNPELANELRAFRTERSKSGDVRIVTNRNKDMTAALSLALEAGLQIPSKFYERRPTISRMATVFRSEGGRVTRPEL